MYILGMVLLTLLVWASGAEATCSGSGTSWSCTAGTTPAQVNSALSSATDGATLTFAAGSYTWNDSIPFYNSKGVTLICASLGACTVAASGLNMGLNGTCNGTNIHLYRISGFVFNGGGNLIWYNANSTPPCTMTGIRIDHNTFSGQSADNRILMFGDNANNSYFYGVVDHNTIINSSNVVLAEFYSSNGSNAPAGTRGTLNNMYFEDNTIAITTMTNSGAGCMDTTGSPGIVWRHNTMTNCLLAAHGTTGGGGVVNFEVYNNTFIVNAGSVGAGEQDGFRQFHHQGSGETLVFNNTFTTFAANGGHSIGMTHYRSASPTTAGYSGQRCDGTAAGDGNRSGQLGYPCKRQPGRDVNGVLNPIYVWNNHYSDSGGLAVMTIESGLWGETNPSVNDHIKLNRDVYNAVSVNAQSSATSPFNGTTGMGFGTLANRPTTCTTGPEAADAGHGGVGYFATDQGAQGTLYRCSAANSWVVHYTPYTYPHPLQAGGIGGGGDITAPGAPTNLRVQ